jgi:hypothetical protein
MTFDGALWPQYAWGAIAQGLAAGGAAPQAAAAAARARLELKRFAEGIDDARAREAFLRIPINLVIAGT